MLGGEHRCLRLSASRSARDVGQVTSTSSIAAAKVPILGSFMRYLVALNKTLLARGQSEIVRSRETSESRSSCHRMEINYPLIS